MIAAIVGLISAFAGVKAFGPDAIGSMDAKETSFERIMRTGTIRCGYALWPPHVLAKDPNTGQFSGISHDLVEEVAKRTNLKVEWVEETGWGNWVESLKNDRFDVFCSGAWQDSARARDVSWTMPYMYSALYLYTRTDDTRFDTDISAVNSENVTLATTDGMMSATVANLFFPKAKQFTLPQLSDSGQQVLAVVTGKAEAVFEEPSTMKAFSANNKNTLKISGGGEPYNTFATTFGMAMGEYELVSLFNSVLIEMQNQGLIEKTVRSYEPDPTVFLLPAKPYDTKR